MSRLFQPALIKIAPAIFCLNCALYNGLNLPMKMILSLENGEKVRRKLIRMGLNSLMGYVIVEVFALVARALNLISTGYDAIVILSLIVDAGVLVFITLARLKKTFTNRSELIFFACQLCFYLLMFSFAVFLANEIRFIMLVCAFIAVTIELPFITPFQTFLISFGSILSYNIVTYFAIHNSGQNGIYSRELFISLSFLAPMTFISYVAKQIINQRKEIETDKNTLELMNDTLNTMNIEMKTARDRTETEMELAGAVQSSLFYKEPPKTTGWDIAFSFRPAYAVSGDFFDFYYSDSELKGFSLFDVSGHGVAAGLITMIARPILYRIFNDPTEKSLRGIVNRASEIFYREIENVDSFITGIVIRFRDSVAEYVNIAHHDLLIKKSMTGEVKAAAHGKGDFRSTPLGRNFGKPVFKTIRFPVCKGDVLCLVTDGILEGRNIDRDRFSIERLSDSLRTAPDETAQEILDHVQGEFFTFIDGAVLGDDYVLIIAKKTV